MIDVGHTFPGGTSVTLLDVYGDPGPDGVAGGTPHVHLASSECYVVVGGSGELETIDAGGHRVIPLENGAVVWFQPGTIHRVVNTSGLQVLVVMENAGLPEAGDAVMTFPLNHLVDFEHYDAVATLPSGATDAELQAAAGARRDLAVEGFTRIRDAILAGDSDPLHRFYAAATRLVSPLAAEWSETVVSRPLQQAEQSLRILNAISRRDAGHLYESRIFRAADVSDTRGYGMCGRLRAYEAPEDAPASREAAAIRP